MLSHPDEDVVVMDTVLPTFSVAKALAEAAEMSTRPRVTLIAFVVRPSYVSWAVVLMVVGLAPPGVCANSNVVRPAAVGVRRAYGEVYRSVPASGRCTPTYDMGS